MPCGVGFAMALGHCHKIDNNISFPVRDSYTLQLMQARTPSLSVVLELNVGAAAAIKLIYATARIWLSDGVSCP